MCVVDGQVADEVDGGDDDEEVVKPGRWLERVEKEKVTLVAGHLYKARHQWRLHDHD